MRRSQPDGVRWELQARLAGRYAIDIDSVCYRSASAQDGVQRARVYRSRSVRIASLWAAGVSWVCGRGRRRRIPRPFWVAAPFLVGRGGVLALRVRLRLWLSFLVR